MKKKKLAGTAKLLHDVYTVCGGLQQYNDVVGMKYIESLVKAQSNSIQQDIQLEIDGKSNRNKIKVS